MDADATHLLLSASRDYLESFFAESDRVTPEFELWEKSVTLDNYLAVVPQCRPTQVEVFTLISQSLSLTGEKELPLQLQKARSRLRDIFRLRRHKPSQTSVTAGAAGKRDPIRDDPALSESQGLNGSHGSRHGRRQPREAERRQSVPQSLPSWYEKIHVSNVNDLTHGKNGSPPKISTGANVEGAGNVNSRAEKLGTIDKDETEKTALLLSISLSLEILDTLMMLLSHQNAVFYEESFKETEIRDQIILQPATECHPSAVSEPFPVAPSKPQFVVPDYPSAKEVNVQEGTPPLLSRFATQMAAGTQAFTENLTDLFNTYLVTKGREPQPDPGTASQPQSRKLEPTALHGSALPDSTFQSRRSGHLFEVSGLLPSASPDPSAGPLSKLPPVGNEGRIGAGRRAIDNSRLPDSFADSLNERPSRGVTRFARRPARGKDRHPHDNSQLTHHTHHVQRAQNSVMYPHDHNPHLQDPRDSAEIGTVKPRKREKIGGAMRRVLHPRANSPSDSRANSPIGGGVGSGHATNDFTTIDCFSAENCGRRARLKAHFSRQNSKTTATTDSHSHSPSYKLRPLWPRSRSRMPTSANTSTSPHTHTQSHTDHAAYHISSQPSAEAIHPFDHAHKAREDTSLGGHPSHPARPVPLGFLEQFLEVFDTALSYEPSCIILELSLTSGGRRHRRHRSSNRSLNKSASRGARDAEGDTNGVFSDRRTVESQLYSECSSQGMESGRKDLEAMAAEAKKVKLDRLERAFVLWLFNARGNVWKKSFLLSRSGLRHTLKHSRRHAFGGSTAELEPAPEPKPEPKPVASASSGQKGEASVARIAGTPAEAHRLHHRVSLTSSRHREAKERHAAVQKKFVMITPRCLAKGDHIYRELGKSNAALSLASHHALYIGNGLIVHFSGNEGGISSLLNPASIGGTKLRKESVLKFTRQGHTIFIQSYNHPPIASSTTPAATAANPGATTSGSSKGGAPKIAGRTEAKAFEYNLAAGTVGGRATLQGLRAERARPHTHDSTRTTHHTRHTHHAHPAPHTVGGIEGAWYNELLTSSHGKPDDLAVLRALFVYTLFHYRNFYQSRDRDRGHGRDHEGDAGPSQAVFDPAMPAALEVQLRHAMKTFEFPPYNLTHNNCEHFVRWTKTDCPVSLQISCLKFSLALDSFLRAVFSR